MASIVLDTNILVSAVLFPSHSLPGLCLDMVLAKRHRLILSPPIMAEYEQVLARPKFRLAPESREALLALLSEQGKRVVPRKAFTLCSDPDDNIFLDAAFAGKAEYVITGNLRHFPKAITFTHVVTARQFIDIF